MKKLFASIICVIFLVSLSYAGVSPDTKTYNYKDFTSIGVSSGMKLIVTQSDNYSITVRGDKSDLKDLIVEQRGNSLRFRFDEDGWLPYC